MKYIVAVSGGVDSMVLLDKLVRDGTHDVIVAHFDHGIRPDSHHDATLVRVVAEQVYGVPFVSRREQLGEFASEALARERRYAFLRDLARQHNAQLVTAHHLDDLVESVAINMTRGTGWRGLAALDSDIQRPFIDVEKSDLIDYARKRRLAWREDSTNVNTKYLRNKLRTKTQTLSADQKRELRALHAHQRALKQAIHKETKRLVGEGPLYSRYFFTHVQPAVALEGLRLLTKGALTRPQLARALHMIKVAKPNTRYEAGNGVNLHFTTRQFSL